MSICKSFIRNINKIWWTSLLTFLSNWQETVILLTEPSKCFVLNIDCRLRLWMGNGYLRKRVTKIISRPLVDLFHLLNDKKLREAHSSCKLYKPWAPESYGHTFESAKHALQIVSFCFFNTSALSSSSVISSSC